MDIYDAIESIHNYVQHGIPPGGFLEAVLENNLMEAVGRADSTSRHNLYAICICVYNDIPAEAWGSKQKVMEWIARHEEKRNEQT